MAVPRFAEGRLSRGVDEGLELALIRFWSSNLLHDVEAAARAVFLRAAVFVRARDGEGDRAPLAADILLRKKLDIRIRGGNVLSFSLLSTLCY